MKTIFKFILGILFFFVLNTCQKDDPTNPFDPDTPKETWTPSGFTASQQDKSIHLSWTQSESRIDGFKIERKVEGADWSNVASPSKTATSWDDNNIIGNKLHEYRLYAYAGTYQSNMVTASVTPVIEAEISLLPATNVTSSTATLNGSVNANGASTTVTFLLKKKTATGWIVVDPTQKVLSGNTAEAVSAGTTELEPGTEYVFKLKAVSSVGEKESSELSFTTNCEKPIVELINVSDLGETSVTLNGRVNAMGSSTTVLFLYYEEGTNNKDSVTATPSPVTGTNNTDVTATLENLKDNTKYYYTLKATNCGGTETKSYLSFTTNKSCIKPTIVGVASNSERCTEAQLFGQVNPNGYATTVKFEYGKTTNFGQIIAASPSPVNGTNVNDVSVTVTGLDGETKYYYRLVTENCGGTEVSTTEEFTTPACCKAPVVSNLSVTNVSDTEATLKGKVNAQGFTASVTFEYGETASLGQVVEASPSTINGSILTDVSVTIIGLKAKTTYFYKLVANNCGGDDETSVGQFETDCTEPQIISASAITLTSSAQLNGVVNAKGFSTTVKFEYGPTQAYGKTVNASPSTVTGSSNTNVLANISGLTVNTHYYGKLIANNCGDKVVKEFEFETRECTKPSVVQYTAKNITFNSATISGEVNANGFNTTVIVEYGKSTLYGGIKYATPSTVTGTTTKSVTANLTGLEMETTYYVRIKVENCGGGVYSNFKTFTTEKVGYFVDSRDNTTYGMVKIGEQVWMAENLAYIPNSSTINSYKDLSSTVAKYYVYGYTGTSVSSAKATNEYKRYGVLYNKVAATLTNTCPSGWQLPTDEDWQILENHLGMSTGDQIIGGEYRGTDEKVGQKLKKYSFLWDTNTGTDTEKFAALPGGHRNYLNMTFIPYFIGEGTSAEFWTNTGIIYRSLSHTSNGIYRGSTNAMVGISVRCIKK